jgi:DNA-binding transcriptional LysR family regulator
MFTELNAAVGGFTIERLRVFCKVAESGSIVLAAKGDPTRQSQFCRQVKELEEFFGAKLIEREGHTIRLTDDGRKLALLTQSYFRSVEKLRASSTKEEEVHIGAGESVFRWLLMPRLAELQKLASGVRLEFHTKTTTQSVEAVKAGQLDLAIVRKEAADDSLSMLPFGSLAYTLVVPRKMLPGKTAAGFHLLQKIPFALLTGDEVLAKGVLALAAKMKVALDIRVRAESLSLLISAIENADLAAVIPVPAVAGLSKERFANIETAEAKLLTRELALVFSPHAAELRESIRSIAPRISSLFGARVISSPGGLGQRDEGRAQ